MLYEKCTDIWRIGVSEEVMDSVFLNFTFNSNKIENRETELKDVETIFRSSKVTSFKENKITLKEIENHKELCDKIFKLSKENSPQLSIDLIKKFHYYLMKGCFREELLAKGERPGEFKKGDYVVGIHEIGAEPEAVDENLKSLIDEVNEVKITDKNALKVISYLHCWFESIHPFADGNGRVGRILLNYLLITNNLPPIVIFYADREQYYSALENFNENQEIDEMVEFLEGQAYRTWIKNGRE